LTLQTAFLLLTSTPPSLLCLNCPNPSFLPADKATPLSLVQHSYFNLAGHDSGTALNHILTIHGDHFTPVSRYCFL